MPAPYVYVDTSTSKPVTRNVGERARVAAHFPDLGRTVELEADADGRYTLTDRAAPGADGPTVVVAIGELDQDCPGTFDQEGAHVMLAAADVLARVQAGEDVGASHQLAGIVRGLREGAERRSGNVTGAAR